MTQFLSGALAGVIAGCPLGVVLSALLFAAKGNAAAQRRSDDEQVEGLIAQRIEPELVQAARLIN